MTVGALRSLRTEFPIEGIGFVRGFCGVWLTVKVAPSTVGTNMRAFEFVVGHRVVVEKRSTARRGVTLRAILREGTFVNVFIAVT